MKMSLAVLSVLIVCALAGCSSDKKEPTGREKLHTQWNNARAGVLYGLAKQQFEGGNYVEARKSLEEALALQPDAIPVRLLSVRALIELGKLESAVKELEMVRSIDPANPEADYLMGVIYQRWQKPETALKWYVQASEKNPAEQAYVLARAEMLVAESRSPEALSYLKERMTYFENSAPIRDVAGQILAASGDFKAAVPMLREAVILSQEDPQVREHYAMALYYAGEHREAAQTLDKLVREERFAKRADLILALGECYISIERFEDARDLFQQAALLQPAQAHVWLALSKAGLACNDPECAEMSLRKAIAIDSTSSDAFVMLGYLRVRQNRLDEALEAFRQATSLDAADTVSICMTGYVLEKQGKSKQALELYGQALRLHPNDELASTLLTQLSVHE